jgi:hypothetical protein
MASSSRKTVPSKGTRTDEHLSDQSPAGAGHRFMRKVLGDELLEAQMQQVP